jgi:hypothetical protein
MLRRLVPTLFCAGLTVSALLVDLGTTLTVVLVLALILSPALAAWVATRGGDTMTYLATGMLAAGAIAVLGGVINEVRSDDYSVGIVFLGTLLVGLMFTLPPVLIAALLRR